MSRINNFTVSSRGNGSCFENELLEESLKRLQFDPDTVYVTCNGKLVPKTKRIRDGEIYHIVPRVLGGKGGFGSMLRSIGAQIEKTTNREACRDLSGRRMRDVNNEQQLREWVAKKAQRERERERKRRERAEKRRQALTDHRHNFDDPDYHSQRMKVLDQLEDALQQGLLNSNSNGSTSSAASCSTATSASTSSTASSACGSAFDSESRKRKAEGDEDERHTKKACEWLGIDMDNLSDFDSDSDSSIGSDKSDSEDHVEGNKCDNMAAVVSDKEDPATEKCGTAMDEKSDSSVSSVNEANETSDSLFVCHSSETTDVEKPKVTDTEQVQESVKTEDNERDSAKHGLLSMLEQLPPKTEQTQIADTQNDDTPLNLENFSSINELETKGLDRLKITLMSMGLKCGGTLQQRAERLWAVKGKSKEEIDPSFFAKPAKKKKK